MRARRNNDYYNGNGRKGGLTTILAVALLIVGVGILFKTNDSTKDRNSDTTHRVVGHNQTKDVNNNTDDNQQNYDNNAENSPKQEIKSEAYHIGDEILVDTKNGSYSLCITGVHETDSRNQFWDKQADRVVIIDYNYENISHAVESDFFDYYSNELLISEMDFKMYDADGNLMDTYPADMENSPRAVSPGHKASATMAYALNNDKNYIEAEYHDKTSSDSDFTIELEW